MKRVLFAAALSLFGFQSFADDQADAEVFQLYALPSVSKCTRVDKQNTNCEGVEYKGSTNVSVVLDTCQKDNGMTYCYGTWAQDLKVDDTTFHYSASVSRT